MSAGRIAILIDGGFFLKRLPKLVAANRCASPGKIVACIRYMCRNHIKNLTGTNDKLARREGIEFILDPLWQQVNSDLFEHIDGLQSGLKRPGSAAPAAGMAPSAAVQANFGQQGN